MHLMCITILPFKKKYVNMAYVTCWDYESVTSFQKKKTTRNGWNALYFCSVSKYPGRKIFK